MRLQGHGERQSLVEESTPSSVRQIQQCLGSPVSGMVWERLGDGCVDASAAVATAGATSGAAAASGVSASCGIVDASAGVGSEVVLCCGVGYDADVSEVEAGALVDGSTNNADSKIWRPFAPEPEVPAVLSPCCELSAMMSEMPWTVAIVPTYMRFRLLYYLLKADSPN